MDDANFHSFPDHSGRFRFLSIMKKKHKDLLIFAVLFISLFFFIPSSKDQPCSLHRSFTELRFYGIVEKKFIDRSQHSSPIVEIRNFENDRIDTISFFFDRSKTFDLINQSDTVYKKTGNLEVHIKRENQPVVISKLDFGCEEDQ